MIQFLFLLLCRWINWPVPRWEADFYRDMWKQEAKAKGARR